MVEYERSAPKELTSAEALKTCIVGIGGAGGNVLDRITLDRTVDAKLVCAHTDVRVLGHSMAPNKIQLGVELMRGVGAGGDPELGREAALYSREQIREAVDGHDIIFVCAGLGGGTGSGATPVVAEIAKSTGALVFITATMPFTFEGKRRLSQAEESLTQLQKRADALILFENNRMGELTLPKDGIQKAFSQADQLIAQSLRAVSTILTTPGLVKLGLDDLTAALNTSNGRCLFGFGEARGQNRGTEAVKRALKSPLIDQGRLLHQTKTLLVHIAGGESLTLLEVDAIMKQLGKNVPDQTHILFGVAVDAKLGDSVCVTLLSSLGLAQLNTVAAAAPPVSMLPMKERQMPSVLDAVSPQTSSPRSPRVRASAPSATNDDNLLFNADEIAQASSATSLADLPTAETPAAPVVAEAPAVELPQLPVQNDLPPFDDFTEEEPASQEIQPEPAPEPVAKPARPRIEDFITEPQRPVAVQAPAFVPTPAPEVTVGLASVVGRGTSLPLPDDEPYNPIAARTRQAASAEEEQIAFQFGSDEDRGRFQQTEPVLADGGEDLDVPTWMRLKRKLKRS